MTEPGDYDPDAPGGAEQVIAALRQRFSDSALVCMTRAEFAAIQEALASQPTGV